MDGNFFSFEHGGIICRECVKQSAISNVNGKNISIDAIKVLRLFLKHNISIIDKIKINNKLLDEVKELTENYLNYISQREFYSKKLIIEG